MTSKPRLKAQELNLLTAVVWCRNAKLMSLVNALGIQSLSVEDRESLRLVLSDEFCEHGLEDNDEPNEYGRAIDDLIGKLRRF